MYIRPSTYLENTIIHFPVYCNLHERSLQVALFLFHAQGKIVSKLKVVNNSLLEFKKEP